MGLGVGGAGGVDRTSSAWRRNGYQMNDGRRWRSAQQGPFRQFATLIRSHQRCNEQTLQQTPRQPPTLVSMLSMASMT
jgi:hypothetical protein